MKNISYSICLAVIAVLFSSASCKKDDSTPVIFNSNTITSGTWRISSFHGDHDDHTADFSNYVFTFDDNGNLSATNSGTTTTGTWSFDDSGNEFHLQIGSTSPLTDISKGWIILESTSTSLRLGDDSSNDEELDFVIL
jgi:hypothetical protein